MGKSFKIKNPYPQAGEQYITERTAKINPDSEGNTDLKDGKSKSSTFQKRSAAKDYKKGYYGA